MLGDKKKQHAQFARDSKLTCAIATFVICSQALEAQQRYFSYRTILVAIVSQNFFALVFMGYRTNIARYVAKWGIARICLCKIKYQGGVSHHFGGVLTSLKKYRAIWGIAAIVTDSIAVSRDMGPLSHRLGNEKCAPTFLAQTF